MIDKDEPLPDTMYSREVSLRLMRHAVWSLYWSDRRSKYERCAADSEAVNLIASLQHDVLQMSTGDFYRIKTLGTPDAYSPKGNA